MMQSLNSALSKQRKPFARCKVLNRVNCTPSPLTHPWLSGPWWVRPMVDSGQYTWFLSFNFMITVHSLSGALGKGLERALGCTVFGEALICTWRYTWRWRSSTLKCGLGDGRSRLAPSAPSAPERSLQLRYLQGHLQVHLQVHTSTVFNRSYIDR
jgi:hypothetical protein